MSSEFTPEDVASRSFGHSLRGYDPTEVRSYLAGLADQVRRLQAQYDAARAELGMIDDAELSARIDNATTDINELLQAARIASEQIRDRAAREASDTTQRAEDAAAQRTEASEADAFSLRKSAWDVSTDMLEQVKAEYARLRQQADRDALAIVGEAERDAHKKIATARRDAESKLRAARLEAERLLVDARAQRDEMIETAERATDAAQERTRALERRREELMAELEQLRLAREAPPEPVGRGVAETVRVVPGGDPSGTEVPSDAPIPTPAPAAEWIEEDDVRVVSPVHAPWADGSDTVRLVESPVEPEDDEVDADEVASEVARLREDREHEADSAPAVAAAPAPVVEPEPTPEPEPDPEPTVRADERDLAKAWSSSETRAVEASGDELGSLFRELRVDSAQRPVPAGTEPSSTRPAPREDDVSEDTPLEELLPAEVVTPFDRRDRALLPITNRALRDVKRQIADVQNLQLDALKNDPANWQPDRGQLDQRLVQELTVVHREAFAAGHEAAGELTGTGPAEGRVESPDGDPSAFVSALFDEVVLTVQAGREAGHGARDLGTSVSRVYRVWRTEEAERRMRHLASRAYHAGVLAGLADRGVGVAKVDVHGSCEQCGELADEEVPVGKPSPVPAHDECRCTIVPA